MKPSVGRLHVITDTSIQNRFGHVELAELAIAGGAETIQFRDKTLGARDAIEASKAIRSLCRAAGVTLIINDRLDIAMAVDADGVHLGQRDLPIPEARRLLGSSKLIGGSASNLNEARQVERDGADYVGFGHIFPTSSKDKPEAAKGPETLHAVCDVLHIPVIAIGGFDASNAETVVTAGVRGVAVIGAVCASEDPRWATARLMAVVETGDGPKRSQRRESS